MVTGATGDALPPQQAALERLCTDTFVGSFGHLAGTLSFHDHDEAVDAGCLADRAFFVALLDRFGTDHPDTDRRALASFWSQHYFAKLTIALTVLCLAAERPLPIAFDNLRVRFCPARGTPLCFHLACRDSALAPDALVKALYEEHITGAVAAVKRHGGLSARLLWENVGGYGIWMVGELARIRPDLAPIAEALLRDPSWPRAGCAMLSGKKAAACEGRVCGRRVCCLRYLLPNVGRCADICPLSPEDCAAARPH